MRPPSRRSDGTGPAAPPGPREAAPAGVPGLAANPYLLLATASLCWSGNHVIGRAIAGHVPPMSISAARWLLPVLVLWLLARPHLAADWPVMRRHWRMVLFLSVTGGAMFSAGQYLALQHTTALNTSVLNSLAPVLIIAAGAALFGERLALAQAAGIATSLAGVVVIVSRGDLGILTTLDFNRGDVILIGNMCLWAIYSVYLRRRPQVHWMSFTFLFALVSGLVTLPFAIVEQAGGFRFQATLLTFGAVIYVAIFPSVVAFIAWVRGVEAIGSSRASPFLHLVPLFSALLASVFLGERLEFFHVAGFGLILAGVFAAARRY